MTKNLFERKYQLQNKTNRYEKRSIETNICAPYGIGGD